jgi:hypothetical protein
MPRRDERSGSVQVARVASDLHAVAKRQLDHLGDETLFREHENAKRRIEIQLGSIHGGHPTVRSKVQNKNAAGLDV